MHAGPAAGAGVCRRRSPGNVLIYIRGSYDNCTYIYQATATATTTAAGEVGASLSRACALLQWKASLSLTLHLRQHDGLTSAGSDGPVLVLAALHHFHPSYTHRRGVETREQCVGHSSAYRLRHEYRRSPIETKIGE
jgi:hypothetical protein